MNVKDISESLKKGSEANKQAHQFNTEGEDVFHRYNEKYRKHHGHSKVICVGMDEPVFVDDVYVDVQFLKQRQASRYGSLKDIEQEFRIEGYKHLILDLSDISFDDNGAVKLNEKPMFDPNQRQDGMSIANDKQYLMVLGGPGVGKSTFLQKVGLEALRGKDGDFEHECTPVFLELKRYTRDSINIETLFSNELEICGYSGPEQDVMTALKSGKFLILLDGLDEVPDANSDDIVHDIRDFVRQYHRNRFIVSSRKEANINGFTDVEIADFADFQVEDYINKWFLSTTSPHSEGVKIAEQCWQMLIAPEHRTIKALAGNPLLLTHLCMVYMKEKDFPPNRAMLYERVLKIFLKRWTMEKNVRRNSPVSRYLRGPIIKKMLSEIAAENFKVDCVFFSEDALINHIQDFCQKSTNISVMSNVSEILDTILVDPGIFVERLSNVYSFLHLTLQEYLTANHFINTQSIQQLVTEHLCDDRWQEVFFFTAELKSESLLEAIEIEAIKSINTDRLKALFRWAERVTDTSDNQYHRTVKRLFAIRQFFSLWMLKKIYEVNEKIVNKDQYLNQCLMSYGKLEFCFDFEQGLYQDLYREIYQNQDRILDNAFYVQRRQSLYQDKELYRALDQDLGSNFRRDPDLHFYGDFYQYATTDFYPDVFSKFGDRFDKDLGERIQLVGRIEEAKVFKGVDLQRIVQRFSEQRAFVNAVRKGEPIEAPKESMHDTWLSVLGITDDMLAISHKEIENYVRYLRAMKLTFQCREAAECVSPKAWKKVSSRLLNWNVKAIEG